MSGTVLMIGGWLAAMNAAAWFLMRADKGRAVAGEWRVPEHRLLTLALFGGWCGAKLAQRQFRHKTRKQPFARNLNAMGAASVLFAGLILWGGLAP